MKNSMKIKKKNKGSAKFASDVKKILKANQGSCCYDEASAPFVKSFLYKLLSEAEEEAKSPEDFTPDQNQADFKKSLESETPEDNFDTEGTDPNITANAITAIKEWSAKLEDFAKFMNNPDTQSLHKILATEDRPGSLLRGVTRKASDSITRIAGEVEKLKEVLNGFIIMAPKKERDLNQSINNPS